MRFSPSLLVAWLCFGNAMANAAVPGARDVEAIYQPFRVAAAALAPDGRHVAFVVRERGGLEAQVYEIGEPRVKARVPIDARGGAEMTFFGWANAGQIVAATDSPLVRAFDASGANARLLVDAKTFVARNAPAPRIRILGFVTEPKPTLLLELVRPQPPEPEVAIELARVDVLTGTSEVSTQAVLGLPGGSLIADRQGAPRLLFSEEELPQRWRYRAATGLTRWGALPGAVSALAATFTVTPQNFLGERGMPLGFGEDGERLYFASNVGRDTQAIYEVNLRTGERATVLEDAEFDLAELKAPWKNPPLVFDAERRKLVGVRRTASVANTRWIDAELAEIQTKAERKFPERSVHLLGWDAGRERFLARVSSLGDPGRYFVHHRADGRWVEYLRHAPNLRPEMLHRTEAFAFTSEQGARVSGMVTWPQTRAVARPPLVVWLHDGPWQRTEPDFNRDVQALAAMGFVVAQVDYCGSAGFGRARREAIRGAWDTAPLAEVEQTVAWLEKRFALDRRRVALVGEGFGGYLALRGLERESEAFRCAVAINAPVELGDLRRELAREERDRRAMERRQLQEALSPRQRPRNAVEQEAESKAELEQMMEQATRYRPDPIDFALELRRAAFGHASGLREFSVLREAGRIDRPVMLLHETQHWQAPIESVRELRDALERRRQAVAFAEIPPQFARGELVTRARVVRRIGEFLNVALYDFDVKIGEAKEKDAK